MPDARMIRNLENFLSDQHQAQSAAKRGERVQKKRKQLRAALVLVDAAYVKREAPVNPVLAPKTVRVARYRNGRANADHHARHVLIAGGGLNHSALLRTVVHQRPYAPEQRIENRQPDGVIPLGRRDENRLAKHGTSSVERLVIPIAPEDEVIVDRVARGDMLNERRAPGSFGLQPLQLVVVGVSLLEHLLRSPREDLDVALLVDRKPLHVDAVDLLHSGRIVIAPGDV